MNLLCRYFFMLAVFFVGGCVSSPPEPISSEIQVPTVALQKQKLIDALRKEGIQVMEYGDNLRIIIPNHVLFYANTPRLLFTARGPLEELRCLLNLCKNYGIKILAYTPAFQNARLNVCLGEKQAQAVADYFWHGCLRTHLVVAMAWHAKNTKSARGCFYERALYPYTVEIRTCLQRNRCRIYAGDSLDP